MGGHFRGLPLNINKMKDTPWDLHYPTFISSLSSPVRLPVLPRLDPPQLASRMTHTLLPLHAPSAAAIAPFHNTALSNHGRILVQAPFTDCNTLASFTPPLCRHFAESVLTTKDRNFACRLRTSSSQEPPTHRQLLSKTVCVRHIPTFVDPSRATTDHSTAVKVSRHHDFLDALGSSYPVPTAISTLSRRVHCQRGLWSRGRESDALKGKKNSTIETVTAASTNSS